MDNIAAIQRALIALGYDLGKGGPSGKGDDGIWGQNTSSAIEAFQKKAGLLGDIGEKTKKALGDAVLALVSGTMRTSAKGRAAITQREGNKLTAYPDPATGGDPWTIGVGHTSAAGPPKVVKGMKITAADSDEILARDLKEVEKAVNESVKVRLSQNEFDALVSLAFNIGNGAFAKSTLVKKLNAGDRAGAADQFLVWNKAAGKVMKGLVTRRQDERSQFLG